MLPSPPHPPTPTQTYVCVYSWECMQAQRMLTSPTPPTHPPIWECMQVQGMLPSPPHPPTPTQRYVCVCVQLGMCASPRYVNIPTPPTHPPQRYVCMCVYRWVPKNMLCVQMSQICVCRWGFWGVCTDESNLCAQMSPLPPTDSKHLWNLALIWCSTVDQVDGQNPTVDTSAGEIWVNS